MKKILQSGIGILIIVMILYILFLQQCRGKDHWIPKGKIVVSQIAWDSLLSRKMDTTINKIVDTFIINEPVVEYIDTGGYTVIPPDTKHYKDSTVNDSIRFWQDLYVQGIVQKWNKRYEPIIHTITNQTTITVPVPQIVPCPQVKGNNGIYLSAVAGGNKNAFILGGEIDLVTKKNNIYGIQYQRYGNQNFYLVKIGTKLTIFNRNK